MKHYLLFYYYESHKPACFHFSGYDVESVKRQAKQFISSLKIETTFELYKIEEPLAIWRAKNEVKELDEKNSIYF